MKKIGIVGGVAWTSTVEYYRTICLLGQAWQSRLCESGRPTGPGLEMCIESLDLGTAVSLVGSLGDEASWQSFDAYHRGALQRLQASGAELALLASNTPHHRFDAITRGIMIPVISIFEAVADECARTGIHRLLILGTALTMRSQVFVDKLYARGIEAIALRSDRDRARVIEIIAQLQTGRHEGAAEGIAGIVGRAFSGDSGSRPVVCLACTELPLAFPGVGDSSCFERNGIYYVNSAAIHAQSAFEAAVVAVRDSVDAGAT